jgi:branched-chain amino acid transport system substrate-binding protein
MQVKLNVIVGAAIHPAGSARPLRRIWSSRSATSAPTSGAIAHLGKDNENGARMAIEELNAKGVTIGGKKAKFELLAEDDAGDPKQGTAAAQKLVDAKVNGVIGHLNSGTTIPASKIYSDAGIPQISPSATNPKYTRQGYKTTFRVVADDVHLGGTLGRTPSRNSRARASPSSTTAPPTARAWPTSSRRASRPPAARPWAASSPTTRRPTSPPS